jgi:hypothetical protein
MLNVEEEARPSWEELLQDPFLIGESEENKSGDQVELLFSKDTGLYMLMEENFTDNDPDFPLEDYLKGYQQPTKMLNKRPP